MKQCPRCNKTYADDNLNFCLEDGSVLGHAGPESQPTVVMGEARPTNPAPQPQHAAVPPYQQANWQPSPQQMAMPAKKSRTWIWVLGIMGVLVLLCGGGFVGFLAFVGSKVNNNLNTAAANSRTNSASLANRNTSTSTSTSSNASSTRDDLEEVDLSSWVRDFSAFGVTEYNGDEFMMNSKSKGFYYVLVAPEGYTTENADTKVTLRNVDDVKGSLGYGLIFHSDPTPLQKDYAFLIDTKRKKFRVVYHGPKKETSVVTWTTSDAIKEGAAENTLEVRDDQDSIELYINGTLVKTIKDVQGFAGGVPGLYAGDGVKVAFKNLEIRK